MHHVSEDTDDGHPTFFLPHHPVIKGSGSTLKLRVVFNASQRIASGPSLNSVVHIGPGLQQNLGRVLLRWRMHRVAFIADIEQMYRQIAAHPEDQSLQRILWRPAPTGPVHVYQLSTVTYGTACAPFLALRVLQQLAQDEGSRFPQAADLLVSSTYVDDVLAGAATLDEALLLQREIVSLLRTGGFALRKWAANNPAVLEPVPENCRLPLVPLRDHADLGTPVLGVQWLPEDAFGYGDALGLPSSNTKRSILSTISRVFNPLGWISPLATVTELRLPRWTGHTPGSQTELRGFCNASERAYAAAVYLVVRAQRDPPVSRLLVAKTKVAPVKPISLPRLEICGAHLLARLLRFALETLHPTTTTTRCWSDSAVVLAWIRQHSSRWNTFVANRVAAIHELLPSAQWGHVPTKENPADCSSRSMSPRLLRDQELWWGGPAWLTQAPEHWPCWEPTRPTRCNTVRVRDTGAEPTGVPPVQDCEGLIASSYSKALRIMAHQAHHCASATELRRIRSPSPPPNIGAPSSSSSQLRSEGIFALNWATYAEVERCPSPARCANSTQS
ncbi:uncharacterized protein LOC116853640 [Odontomachus brunneus]|uniref:uncharacterized protein LOC116853640 n=1 Tax=Odontomachus brunneus TaxID=486640 RepID=UPI0013F2743C|nr:uncharacterized protein LOC116853640 [Odontomachus brunneus]